MSLLLDEGVYCLKR